MKIHPLFFLSSFVMLIFLAGCDNQEIQQLSKELNKTNLQLGGISDELETARDKNEQMTSVLEKLALNLKSLEQKSSSQAQEHSASFELFTKSISPKIAAILAGQKKEELSRKKVQKNSHPTEIGIIDLDAFARKLAERKTESKQQTTHTTKDEDRQIATLKRKEQELRRLAGDQVHFHMPGREIKRPDLSEEEKKKVTILKEEISTLQDEVGHLDVKPVSLFDVKDEAQRLVIEQVKGKYLIVIDRGFHGGKSRILFHDDSIKIIDLTPVMIQKNLQPDEKR